MIPVVSELAVLFLLGGMAVLPASGAGFWLVAGPLLVAACLPARPVPGRLRRDRAALMLAALFVAGSAPAGALLGWRGLFLILPAGVLMLLGMARFSWLGWSRLRGNLTLTAVVTLAACALVTAGARGSLALRSSLPVEPGRIDFLGVMGVLAAVWFGLDTHLRSLPASSSRGGLDGLLDRLRPLLLLVALLLAVACTRSS